MPVAVDFDVYEKPESEEGSEYAELISQLAENFDRTATLRLEGEEDLTIKRVLRQVNAAAKAAGYSLREWQRTEDSVTVSVRKPRPRKPKEEAASPAEPVVIGKAAA